MQDHFLQYLDQAATPERKLVYQNAMETLGAAGVRDHQYYIDQMMEQDDLGDSGDFLQEVDKLLNDAIHVLLLQFGVTLSHECNLTMATDILKSILAMDNWSDPDSLSAACDSSEGSEVTLASLLEIVGGYHEADYLPLLERVSVDLIERIDTLNQTFDSSALPSDEERARAQKRVEQFFAHYSAPILSQAISEMLLIGGGYHALMEPYSETISNQPIETSVNELVGFALASDLEDEALEAAIAAECQGWWDANPAIATQLSTLVRARLKEATS